MNRVMWSVSSVFAIAVLSALAAVPPASAEDRTYTWTIVCEGDLQSVGGVFFWTQDGAEIAGTRVTPNCGSGTGTRPANANGFSAGLGAGTCYDYGLLFTKGKCTDSDSLERSFDSAGPFDAKLSVRLNYRVCTPDWYSNHVWCERYAGSAALVVSS